jgi:hypothetical protein
MRLNAAVADALVALSPLPVDAPPFGMLDLFVCLWTRRPLACLPRSYAA